MKKYKNSFEYKGAVFLDKNCKLCDTKVIRVNGQRKILKLLEKSQFNSSQIAAKLKDSLSRRMVQIDLTIFGLTLDLGQRSILTTSKQGEISS